MKHPERIYFEKLKEEIALRYREKNPEAPAKIEEWGVKTIAGFQEHLQEVVKSAISTRWFYSHIKESNEDKIPRVDVLDLLSQYAGYDKWRDFIKAKKSEGLVLAPENAITSPVIKTDAGEKKLLGDKKRRQMLVILLVAIIVPFATNRMIFTNGNMISSSFCFTDADLGMPLKNEKIRITVFREDGADKTVGCDSTGCFVLKTKPGKVTFIVNAEYYHSDTVTRMIAEETEQENIRLRPDDYARMISIFSNSKVEDWERRKKQLDAMFNDDAQVFQVDPVNQNGMEMYNKEEFINKLTMPLSSLKNIEVIETVYSNKKISTMRFIQKDTQ